MGLGTLVGGMAVTAAVHAAARCALWAEGTGPASVGLAERLAGPELWPEIALRAVGQAWYLSVASLGLAVLGVVALLTMAAGRWPSAEPASTPRRMLAGHLLVTMAVMAFASAVQITTHVRVDHLVYGRYNEGFLPVLLVAGVPGCSGPLAHGPGWGWPWPQRPAPPCSPS